MAEAGNTKVEQIGNIATNYGPLQPVLPSQTSPLTPVACGPDFTHYVYFKGCRVPLTNVPCNIPPTAIEYSGGNVQTESTNILSGGNESTESSNILSGGSV